MTTWTTTAKGQRIAVSSNDPWPAGEYTLAVDRWSAPDGTEYVLGDTITLDEAEATRMGNAGAIAPAGTPVEDDTVRERRRLHLRADALDVEAQRLRREAGGGATTP